MTFGPRKNRRKIGSRSNGRKPGRRPNRRGQAMLSIPISKTLARRLRTLISENEWDLESYIARLIVAAVESLEEEKKPAAGR